MANYKKITDAVAASEVTENMNVLVEDGGSLKKISLGNVSSSDVTTLIFRRNDDGSTYTCENGITLEELRNMIMQGAYIEAFEILSNQYFLIDKIEVGDDYIAFYRSTSVFQWTSNGISMAPN